MTWSSKNFEIEAAMFLLEGNVTKFRCVPGLLHFICGLAKIEAFKKVQIVDGAEFPAEFAFEKSLFRVDYLNFIFPRPYSLFPTRHR